MPLNKKIRNKTRQSIDIIYLSIYIYIYIWLAAKKRQILKMLEVGHGNYNYELNQTFKYELRFVIK